MSKVIDFAAEREKRQPHIQGEGFCLACLHEWQAVAPVGVFEMECPKCGLMRGVWMRPFEGDRWSICANCRCAMFALVPEGPMCLRCGLVLGDWRPTA